MDHVQIRINQSGDGAFFIMEDEEQIAEMAFALKNQTLTVFHTEVIEKAEGRGLAKELLNTMVSYAIQNKLKVVPLCPYVHLQFARHPEKYGDIWMRSE